MSGGADAATSSMARVKRWKPVTARASSAVVEMPIGRRRRNAYRPRQVAQAQPRFALALEDEQGRFEQGIAQVAMVVGRVLQEC